MTLVLDGNQRSALAVTRSLGRRGVPVYVADESRNSLAGASRFCAGRVVYPSPRFEPEAFIATLRRTAEELGICVLFPMTDLSLEVVLRHRDALGPLSIPCPPLESFLTLSDKWSLSALAQCLSIPTPRTRLVTKENELLQTVRSFATPTVLKAVHSWTVGNGSSGSSRIHYVNSPAQLENELSSGAFKPPFPVLVQERIMGQGQGVFALYDRGQAVLFFAHRRVREKPPSGGVSVVSESIPVSPRLERFTRALLDAVGWHGVAMAEFTVAPDGAPFLIEVNGRFWGSLQLAVEAGVDFPWLLYQIAIGKELDEPRPYRYGIRCRWLLGDLDHLYLRLASQTSLHQKWEAIRDFIRPSGPWTRHEVNRLDDLGPFIFELQHYFLSIFRS